MVLSLLTFSFQIAGDLLDLVGDGAFETVQDLLLVSCTIFLSMMVFELFSSLVQIMQSSFGIFLRDWISTLMIILLFSS